MEQQVTQTPPGLPDHRVDEMSSRMKQLEDQNNQLRGMIDQMSRQNSGQAPQPSESEKQFQPEVVKALKDIIQQQLNPFAQQVQNQIGMVYDQTDEAKFRTLYSDPKYAKYESKIEQLRREAQQQGRYLSRIDALKFAHWEETGKKANETPVQTPNQTQQKPIWSSFFNAYIDPVSGNPIDPQLANQPDPNAQQMNEQQVSNNVQQHDQQMPPAQPMPWQNPVQAKEPAPQPYQPMPTGFTQQQPHSNHPDRNPFALPPQGVNNPVNTGQQRNTNAFKPLDLESSPEELKAFEEKFGNIEF